MARAQDNNGPNGLRYETQLDGVDGELRQTMVESLNLFRLHDRLPSSVPALRARLDADLSLIEKILNSEGYYGFRIDHRIDSRAEPVRVDIHVDPKSAYRLSRYEVEYPGAEEQDQLPKDPETLGIALGEPARAEPIVAAETRLIRLLGEQGYPFAAVQDRKVLVHHDNQVVTVTLTVRAGPKVAFGAVAIAGNERVEADYIRRLAQFDEASRFSLSRIDDARRRLFATGLFDSVVISWPQSPDGRSNLPTTIAVKERDRRTIATGIYYSSTDGAGVEGSWTHRNLFGRGERLELGARLAERELSAYADFLKPNVGRLDQNITARADLKQAETDAYDQTSAAATVGVQRKLGDRWKGSLATALEAVTIREPDEPEQRYIIFGFPGQLAYDGSNDLFDPSEGLRLTIDATPNQVFGDSTATFLYGSVSGSAYQEVLPDKRLILAARARIATLAGAETDDIPASRRLYAGGGGSVRGYAYQSIGPLDANNNPEGGRSLVEGSLEARIRVTDTIGFVPFIDGGSVSSEAWPTGDSFQWAAGIGFRYFTPIGPLRLDVATPLNRRQGVDDLYAIYISLGQAF